MPLFLYISLNLSNIDIPVLNILFDKHYRHDTNLAKPTGCFEEETNLGLSTFDIFIISFFPIQ